MAFALMDDQIAGHPKFARAGLEAVGLWALCLSHCSAYLTDGRIDRATAERFAGAKLEKLAHKLVTCGDPGRPGLWDVTDGGWQMHDYLDWNPSREQVLAKREQERARKADGRNKQGRTPDGRITSARNPSGQGAEEAAGHTGSHAHAHSSKEPESSPPAGARVMESAAEQRQWQQAWTAADLPGMPLFHLLIGELKRTPEHQRPTPEAACRAYKQILDALRIDGMSPRVGQEHMASRWGEIVDICRGVMPAAKPRSAPRPTQNRGQVPVPDKMDFRKAGSS